MPEPEVTPTPTPIPEPTLSPAEFEAAQQLYIDVGCDICHGVRGEGGEKGPELKDLTVEEITKAVREGIRTPGSKYTREMEPYSENDLFDGELEQIISYLQSLE